MSFDFVSEIADLCFFRELRGDFGVKGFAFGHGLGRGKASGGFGAPHRLLFTEFAVNNFFKFLGQLPTF